MATAENLGSQDDCEIFRSGSDSGSVTSGLGQREPWTSLRRSKRKLHLSYGGRSAPTGDKRDNQKNDSNDEKHVSDPSGLTCCSTESKKFSDDGNNKEN
jgi:hypothetical protein